MASAPHHGLSEADSLVDTLTAAGGIFCSFAPPATVGNSEGLIAVVNCAGRGDFSIHVFSDAKSTQRFVHLDVAVSCKLQGPVDAPVTYASGGDWVLTGRQDGVRLAAKVLAGEVVTAHC